MLHVRLVLQAVKPTHWPIPLHVSPLVQVLWSLHGEPAGSKWQVELQQSPFSVLPSSHCSPGSTLPFPHSPAVTVGVLVEVGGTGVALAVAVGTWVGVFVGVRVRVAVSVAVGGMGVRVGVSVGVQTAATPSQSSSTALPQISGPVGTQAS